MPTDVRSPSAGAPGVRRGWRLTETEFVGFGGLGALVVARMLPADHIEDGPVVCPFRLLTGLPCPGCGLTRSWVCLLHGEWQHAVAANAFGPAAVLGVLLLVVVSVRARVAGHPPTALNRLVRRPPVVAVAAVWLAYAVVRLVLAL